MNKKMFIVIMSLLVSLTGCGSSKTMSSSPKEKINIKDIAWNVDEGIVDGERCVLLDYTNNANYTITGFELTFKEKKNITEEEKSKLYSEVKESCGLTDEYKNSSISMYADSNQVVNIKESISNVHCYYDNYYYVRNINHYKLMEPDIATIKYIDNNKVYTEYYDFSAKKYSLDKETQIANQWSKTELGDKIPKTNAKVVEIIRDDQINFTFNAYGLSRDQFNAYVEECEKRGYNVDLSYVDGFYSANSKDGYNIKAMYDEDDYSITAAINSPKANYE